MKLVTIDNHYGIDTYRLSVAGVVIGCAHRCYGLGGNVWMLDIRDGTGRDWAAGSIVGSLGLAVKELRLSGHMMTWARVHLERKIRDL